MRNRLIAIVALGTVVASQASACSVCIAHAIGAGLTAVGAQTLPKGHFVIGISHLTFSKTQDAEAEEEDSSRPSVPPPTGLKETHIQSEYSINMAYGLTDLLMLSASIPYVSKSLEIGSDPRVLTDGLGDASLRATYQVPAGMRDPVLFALTFDTKFATGRNNIRRGGTLLEEHSQLGTGSTDFSLGAIATTEIRRGLFFAGVQHRMNGSNGRGYRYGATTFYNIGASFHVDAESDIILELNGRVGKKDRTASGDFDENSGGHLAYLALSYRRSLCANMGLVLSYQSPLIRRLNGSQVESPIMTIGFSASF